MTTFIRRLPDSFVRWKNSYSLSYLLFCQLAGGLFIGLPLAVTLAILFPFGGISGLIFGGASTLIGAVIACKIGGCI